MNSTHPPTELLSEMIGLVYEAAADLSLWPQLLECMSGYLELSLSNETPNESGVRILSPVEHSLISLLAPHFERANMIHLQLTEAHEERNLLEKIMNRLPLGAAIIDSECNAISLNRTLISTLQVCTLLKLVNGKLVSTPANELAHAVAKVIAGEASDDVVRLGDADNALSLWICRGSMSNPTSANPTRLMLFVASRNSHSLSELGLEALYGLTPAEARVAQKLALGGTLDEAAENLSISKNTAKTHLSRVFNKVGVKRQTELIQAVYASPLWLQTGKLTADDSSLALSKFPRAESEEQRIRLSDGRWLYFSDNGDPKGHPVIFMHGIAGSRYLRHPDDGILMQEGIRLIIPERPGSGDSDAKPNRRVLDWPQDIAELVNHLGLKQFSVLGYSAGTSYALAVATAMPQRVQTLHLIAAVSPITAMDDFRAYNPVFRMTLFIARYTPALLPALMRSMVKDIRKNVYQYLEKIFAGAPQLDRAILANPKLRVNIAEGLRASVRCNEEEIAHEVLLTARDWELDLSKVSTPSYIWYGEKDPLVSPVAASKLANLLPNVQLNMIPEAGHYLLYTHWQAILQAIKISGQ